MDERAEVSECMRVVRAHASGVLRCDETPEPVKFVLSRADHSVVLPVERGLLEAEVFLLCLPDDSFDLRVRLLLRMRELERDYEVDRDRHLAYHGETTGLAWVRGVIDHAHTAGGIVVDGGLLMRESSLRAGEARLCRLLNADRDRLRDATELLGGVRVEEPLAVGVDAHGFDVRAYHGIVRVEFPSVCHDEQTATRVIRTLLDGGADGG
ncbi:MAG: hypothetical protein ACF8Q5_03425 [Phycisphaerales bacterium JB040]